MDNRTTTTPPESGIYYSVPELRKACSLSKKAAEVLIGFFGTTKGDRKVITLEKLEQLERLGIVHRFREAYRPSRGKR